MLQCLRGSCESALEGQCQPELLVLSGFPWEESLDVCNFRRWNPPLCNGHLAKNDHTFPKE